MKVGNRVTKKKVMNVTDAQGTVNKITETYVVVVWDKVNGFWHYTKDQAKTLKVIGDEQETESR